MVELQKARDFPLYPYALAVQEIAEIPEIHDHVIQLVQGDTSDLLNERTGVRNHLGCVFRAQTAPSRVFCLATQMRRILKNEIA